MAKLTDLPDELLLNILAGVSPLYIDCFVLSCKRFYFVGINTVRAHKLARRRLGGSLLRTILQVPVLALYPLSLHSTTPIRRSLYDNVPQDLFTKMNLQIAQSPHPGFPKVIKSRHEAEDMVLPLLITRLLNLRKIDLFGVREPYLLDTVSGIIEASHHKGRRIEEPLALGRLTEVSINARNGDMDALHLAVLLSMIPTVRKLNASKMLCNEPYSFPYKHHGSSIRNICVDGGIGPSFIEELIMSTHDLQSFEFTLLTDFLTRSIVFRHLSDILLQHAGASLVHLTFLIEGREGYGNGLCFRSPQKIADLSLGSLRGFHNLKTLTTRVDMFMRTPNSNSQGIRTATFQKLVSWLPASLEALVLHKGLRKWHKDTLYKLFQGLRGKKQARVPNLKLIDFVDLAEFDKVMPPGIRAMCRALGIKFGYTRDHRLDLHWRVVVAKQLELFEGLPWVVVLGE